MKHRLTKEDTGDTKKPKEMWALQPEDNRELMQSRTLIKDCCAMRIDLLSNTTVVDRAIKFVDRHKDLINASILTQS